jgi:hypothetical protein
MPTQAQYWYFLIGGPIDDSKGLVNSFYAYGQHCGEALANALQAATEELGISQPEATEAARLDILTDFEEPQDLIQLGNLVFCGPNNYSYPLDSSENDFIPPTGIIKSTEDGEFDYELIKENFIGYKSQGSDIYKFELVAEKSKLLSTFIQAIAFLPQAEKLEIIIQGHWEGQLSEMWVVNLAQSQLDAVSFLLENQSDILENGFVECALYSTNGQTKLLLDEHKKIRHYTKDEAIFSSFGMQIMELGFEQSTELYNLEYGFYHWHYRPVDSLDAPELRMLLIDAGFEFIKSWAEEASQQYPDLE